MDSFLHRLSELNSSVNSSVWGCGLYLLVGTGIFMTVLTRGFQIRYIRHWFKSTVGGIISGSARNRKSGKSISQFQALCTALAATIGVGNIAGVAAAVTEGGPGAVFWMWIAAALGMMTNYSENVLGIYFRRKNPEGEWVGGAMYYLENGIGSIRHCKYIGKLLAVMFALFCILASFGIGNMGQVNKIVTNFSEAFKIPFLSSRMILKSIPLYNFVIGTAVAALEGCIIMGGLKRIAVFAERLVPFMVILFVSGSLIVILNNYYRIIPVLQAIFKGAFSKKAVWGAAEGIALKKIITLGCKRGMFSNEAGLGSTVMVNSSSDVTEPAVQGMWGIFQVFTDTIVVCTLTALVILTSGVIDLNTGALVCGMCDDSTLAAKAFETVFGHFGSKFVAISIFLFAFTTLLGWSQYGAMTVDYLFKGSGIKVYRILFVLLTAVGSAITPTLAWELSDTFNALMMLPNLIGIVLLSGLVVRITENYKQRTIYGKKTKPMLSASKDIQRALEREILEQEITAIKSEIKNKRR